jgi:hypothetical protein
MNTQLSAKANRIWSAVKGFLPGGTEGVKPEHMSRKPSVVLTDYTPEVSYPALDRSCLLTAEENPPRRSLAHPSAQGIYGSHTRPGSELL